MAKRRSRGDGGLYWDEQRQRWTGEATAGYTPAGRRIVRKARGKTKTEAKNKLDEILRDLKDGVLVGDSGYTVDDAVRNWLLYGLNGRTESTKENRRILAEGHIIPALGARKLRDLTADEVDEWLSEKAKTLSTSTLRRSGQFLLRQ
jgi:hypothetical protein